MQKNFLRALYDAEPEPWPSCRWKEAKRIFDAVNQKVFRLFVAK